MNCDHFKMLLSAYVDGEVHKNERVEVESHLVRCSSCSVELNKLNRLKDLLGYLEVKEPALGFRDRLGTKLMTAQPDTPFWSRLKIWVLELFPQPLTYAFLFLLLLIGSSFVFLEYRSTKSTENVAWMQPPQPEEFYAEDVLFESTLGSDEGEDLLSFNLDKTPFEDLLEGVDSGG